LSYAPEFPQRIDRKVSNTDKKFSNLEGKETEERFEESIGGIPGSMEYK